MSNKSRTFIPREEQAAPAEVAAAPVTPENVAEVLATEPDEATKIKWRARTLREEAPEWPATSNAARLRQSINFLHALGMIPDSEAIRLKAEVETQERA